MTTHTETQAMCEALRAATVQWFDPNIGYRTKPDQLCQDAAALITRQQEEIETLFDAIKHGDQEHQDWLKAKIKDHFSSIAALQAKP